LKHKLIFNFSVLRDRLNAEAKNDAKTLRKTLDPKKKLNNPKREYLEDLTDSDEDSVLSKYFESEDAILDGYRIKIKFPIHYFIKNNIE
jgi:hypothetical protein